MAKISVVTIGRPYCAGGSAIGKLVAERLGVPCYDREIIEMAAQRSGIAMSEVRKYEESVLSPMRTPIAIFGQPNEDITEKIFAAETEVVMELAGRGGCVIVGRCADFILKNKVRTLNVFIYASPEKRIETAMTEHNIPADEAPSRLRKYDKKRSSYYNANTTKKWGEKESYDIILDSGRLGYELCAKLITTAVEASE